MLTVRRKWRPSLWLIVALVVLILVTLPLIGVLAAKLTSNQFVRETEESLLAQAAVYSQAFAVGYRTAHDGPRHGVKLSPALQAFYAKTFHPKETRLIDSARNILDPRPDPTPVSTVLIFPYSVIGATLSDVATAAQKSSLAGYQALDHRGQVVGGTGQVNGSFAQVPEVQAALRGEVTSVIRFRDDRDKQHPLASLSRDTGYRVFVASPVIVDQHVVGAVYLARTPNNLTKFLFQQGDTILGVAVSVIAAAAVVGFLLWRLVTDPIRKLQEQSMRVASGQVETLQPMPHYGTKELAEMGQSVMRMSEHLNNRAVGLQTYSAHVTHELKSPLTGILGAVELLESDSRKMAPKDRAKFYGNIREAGQRMTRLLDELRTLAEAKVTMRSGHANLAEAVKAIQGLDEARVSYDGPDNKKIALADQDLRIVLTHLYQNAVQHGADHVWIAATDTGFSVRDDGNGLSPANADKIFDPFFTTRRDHGGTGMGLAIIKSLIEARDGEIDAVPSSDGAIFEIKF